MVSSRARVLGLGLVTALGFASPAARADQAPTASERETARSQMSEGRDRRARKDLQGALRSFQAADAIMHVPTTALEVIRTEIALGQLVEARGAIRELFRLGARPDEPKPFAEARATALALDAELAARIPSIHVTLENAPAEPHVTIDGVAIPAAALGASIKVDPGRHVVEAAPGGGGARAEVTVAEGEDKPVKLTLPELPVDRAPLAPSADAAPQPASHGASPRTIAIAASFGTAGVGLVVGSIAGLVSMQKTNALKGVCDADQCPASSSADLNTARSLATVSTLAFVVAGAGVGVGLGALVFSSGKAAETTTASVQVTPWVGLGTAGLRGTF